MIGNGSPAIGRSDLTPMYAPLFIERAHQLIALGYGRMPTSRYAESEEEDISGDLADEIDEILVEPTFEWMRFYSVQNERPAKDRKGKRRGKQRQRIDLHIDSSCESRRRQRYSFEAKRLTKGKGVTKYLGPEGLGCFINGEYASQATIGGMLGFVQNKTPETWASAISEKLAVASAHYAVILEGAWTPIEASGQLDHLFQTIHDRVDALGKIQIHHILLDFR